MGLYKRDSIWWMSYTYKSRQVRKSTGTSDRRLAEAILAKVKVKIIEGRYFEVLEEKDRTFAEMMEKYMNEHSIQKSPTGHRRNQESLKHLRTYFGDMTLAEVTPKLISAYKAKRYEEKAAPATLKKELSLMRAAFNLAIREWEWCRDNPLRGVKMDRVDNERVRYLSDDDFKKVLNQCPYWVKPVVLVARYTGMRRGNIVTLRWDQVDVFGKVILLGRTKNGGPLGIPICETLMKVFKSLGKVKHLRSNYVFTRPNGNPYTGDAVGMAFKRACDKAGILDFHFHDLRHTFASSLVQKGVDLYRVQRLLGHRDGRMTQRYSHLAPENLREAVRLLDKQRKGYHNFITAKNLRRGTNDGSP